MEKLLRKNFLGFWGLFRIEFINIDKLVLEQNSIILWSAGEKASLKIYVWPSSVDELQREHIKAQNIAAKRLQEIYIRAKNGREEFDIMFYTCFCLLPAAQLERLGEKPQNMTIYCRNKINQMETGVTITTLIDINTPNYN